MKNKENFIKKFFFLISFLPLIYVIYKSELANEGMYRDYYKIYYYLSFIIIGCISVFYFLKLIYLRYFLIIISSIFLALYLFQAYHVFYFSKYHKTKTYFNETGKKYDTREVYEIYLDTLAEGNKKTVSVPPKYFTKKKNINFHPLSSISRSQTIHCNENGYFSEHLSDRYGFNNPDQVWDEDVIDYLIIGDSFARGACVNREHDIASQLRKHSKKNVITIGFDSNGPLTSLAALREYSTKKTKKVIWLYHEDSDLNDLNLEYENKILKKYLDNENFSQNLKEKQKLIDETIIKIIKEKTIEKKKEKKNYNQVVKFLKLFYIRNIFFPLRASSLNLQPDKKFKQVVLSIKNFTAKNNIDLYFVYMPDFIRYAKEYDNSHSHLKNIEKIMIDNEVKFINIDELVFKNVKNPFLLFPFKMKGHYNIEGYERVSKAIFQFIRGKN